MRHSRSLSPAPSAAAPSMSDAPHEEDAGRTEPVVTYSRLSAADMPEVAGDGRLEPRLGAPSGRRARRVAAPPHVDAVLADVMPASPADGPAHIGDDDLADLAADARPSRRAARKGSRIALAVGLIALFGGAGVLAATFSDLLRGDVAVATLAPPAASGDAVGDIAGGAEDVASEGAVASDVRIVGPQARPESLASAAVDDAATALPQAAGDALAGAVEAPGRVITDPPLPRLRPAQTFRTAVAEPTAEPVELAPGPRFLTLPGEAPAPIAPSAGPPSAGMPAAAPPAARPGDPDADALMADVERILAERRAALAQGSAAAPSSGDPVLLPPSGGFAAGDDSGFVEPEPLPPLAPAPGRYRPILSGDVLPTPPATVPRGIY